MRITAAHALVVYSGALTAALIGVMVLGALRAPSKRTFTEIDVQRINVREPDGTLRMTISNQASLPQIIVKNREYPHPGREAAGMLFFNDEGTENGGLIFSGKDADGVRTSAGSLTFDRYHQDQTVQVVAQEEGARRMSGLRVNDQPEGLLDFPAMARISAMPPGPEQSAALANANAGGTPRVFLGRQASGASELVLRDAAGRKRLVLSVAADGAATLDFLDEQGRVARTVKPDA